MDISDLLLNTKKNGASDLHLAAGSPPAMRVRGDIMPLRMPPLTGDDVKGMLYAIMTERQRADYERDLEIDFAVQLSDKLRFRVNAYNTLNGPSAAFRGIPTEILTLDELGAPEIFKKISGLHKGLVLVTGPTGSGKSTTLAAMINHINDNMPKHIITVEDPIEFVHKSKKALINQRELGTHTMSFSRALKSSLREDPDVILVGEMRDLETIQLALTAAETGHLVFGTLHTNSAAKTIDRVIDAFPAGDKDLIRSMLSTSIEAVISQSLIKTADGKGRVAAMEIMLGTPAIRNLIREGKLPQIYSLMQVGAKKGMRTMHDSVYNLFEQGKITMESVKEVLNLYDEEDRPDIGEAVDASERIHQKSTEAIAQDEQQIAQKRQESGAQNTSGGMASNHKIIQSQVEGDTGGF